MRGKVVAAKNYAGKANHCPRGIMGIIRLIADCCASCTHGDGSADRETLAVPIKASNGKVWLSRKEAAAWLVDQGFPVAPRTLARLAAQRKGPPYVRFLHRVVTYDRDVLLPWARENAALGGQQPSRAA